MGGPVAPDTLHYLHNVGEMIPKSVHVGGNISGEEILILSGII